MLPDYLIENPIVLRNIRPKNSMPVCRQNRWKT